MTVEVLKETIKQALMTEPSPPRFRLSQLKECLRQQWFEVNEPEPEGETNLIELGHFLKGRLFEDWVASAFPEAVRQHEVELHGIKGHIDLFIPPDVVIEVKTTTTQSLVFAPSYDHVWQVKAYLAALKSSGVDEPKGFLVYIPADNPAKCLDYIFPIDLSDHEYEMLLNRAKTLSEATDSPPPIPSDYSPDKLPCAGIIFNAPYRCPYFEKCWGEIVTIVPRSWVDGLGAQLAQLDEVIAAFEKVIRSKEEIERRIKEAMREKGLTELVISGDQFEVVAQMSEKPRKTVDLQALKEDLGEEILRRYVKETYPIYVRWRKK